MVVRVQSKPRSVWRTRNVIVLGVVSLLNDSASEMVIPLLPAFLASIGAGALALGAVEGSAEFISSVLKLAAGRWSDWTRRYRPFVLVGYALAALVRPFLAFAESVWQVMAIRGLDRTGKGLRTSPRDALIANAVPREQRGKAFGLHRAMDHAGAVVGPVLATLVLALWTHDLRILFALAAIPGVLAVVVAFAGVREIAPPPPTPEETAPEETALAAAEEPSPGRSRTEMVRLLVPLGLFTLGNASDTFLLLKAGQERASLETLPLLWMAFHIVKSITSVVGGGLSDRIGRRSMIVFGWVFYAGVYVAFAFATSTLAVWILFVVYGTYYGLTEAPEKALVSELVPKASWGTGFGAYHLVVGVLSLAASLLFGGLWELFGAPVAFLTAAALALVAAVALWVAAPGARRAGA